MTALVIESRFLKEPIASRLRARGQVPEQAVMLVGLMMMLSPASTAFLAAFMGLSTTQLAWYAAASTLGIAYWGWRYEDVVFVR